MNKYSLKFSKITFYIALFAFLYLLPGIAMGEIVDPQVQRLIDLLHSEDNDKKAYAASGLAEKEAHSAIPHLIQELNTKNNYLRAYIIQSIEKFGDSAVPLLIKACGSEKYLIRGNSADALGKIKNQAAVVPLLNLLNDKKSYVRKNAILALSYFNSPKVMTAFIEKFKTERKARNRSLIINALVGYKQKGVLPTIVSGTQQFSSRKDVYVRKDAVSALAELAFPEGVLPLITSLADPDGEIQGIAKQGLVKICKKDASSFKLLLQAVNDKNPIIVANAASALGDIGSKEASLTLISKLGAGEDQSKEQNKIILNSAVALAKIKDSRAVDPLIVLLQSFNDPIRLAAIEALGAIGDTKATSAIIPVVFDFHKMVKVRAITILGDFKAKEAIEALQKVAAEDKTDHIRTLAQNTIKRINGNQ